MPAVSPIIEAAWIAAASAGTVGVVGIAGAVVTSIVSPRNTAKATTQTVEAGVASTAATLAAAREDRLWDKRAAAYEETIAGLLYRQENASTTCACTGWTRSPSGRLKDFFASYEPPGWFEAQARLVAYASDEVRHASDATQQADREVSERYRQWATLGDDNRRAVESGNPGAAQRWETTMKEYSVLGPRSGSRGLRRSAYTAPSATNCEASPKPPSRSHRPPPPLTTSSGIVDAPDPNHM